jgi:hypothetical protein
MANPSCFFECQEEKTMGKLRSTFLWQLIPDALELLRGKLWEKIVLGLLVHHPPSS